MLGFLRKKLKERKYKNYSADDLEELVKKYADEGDRENFEIVLKDAIDVGKTTPAIYLSLATDFFNRGEPTESCISVLEKAIEDGKAVDQTYINLAALLHKQGSFRKAATTLQDAEHILPDNKDVRKLLMNCYVKTEGLEEKLLNVAIREVKSSKHPVQTAKELLCYIADDEQKKKEASCLLWRSMQEGVYDNIILTQLMLDSVKKGREEDADKIYNLALKNDCTHPDMYLFYSDIKRDTLQIFEEAIKRRDANTPIYAQAAFAHLRKGNLYDAEKYFGSIDVEEMDDKYQRIFYQNKASLKFLKRELGEACEALEEAIDKGLGDIMIFDQLIGYCQMKEGSQEEYVLYQPREENSDTMRISKKAVECGIYSGAAACMISLNHAVSGEYDSAIQLLEKSYDYHLHLKMPEELIFEVLDDSSFTPQFVNYMSVCNTLGMCHAAKGDFKKVKEYLLEAYEGNHILKAYLPHLVHALSKEHDFQKLQEVYDYAVLQNKDSPELFKQMYLSKTITKQKYHKELLRKTKDEEDKDKAYAYLSQEAMDEGKLFGKSAEDYLTVLINESTKKGTLSQRTDDLAKDGKVKMFTFDGISSTLIMKASENIDELESERENLEKIKNIVMKKANTPKSVPCFEYEGEYYFAMSYEHALPLTHLIKTDQIEEEEYLNALHVLAKLHVLMPREQEKYDFRSRIGPYVKDAGLDERVASDIMQVVPVLEQADHWGYSKDAFTDNWLFGDGNLPVIIDTENKGLVPYALDLASFLNFIPYYTDIEERIYAVNQYVDSANTLHERNNLGEIDKNIFLQEFLAGTLFRSIEKSGYFRAMGRNNDASIALGVGKETAEYVLDNKHLQHCSEEVENIRNHLKVLDNQ